MSRSDLEQARIHELLATRATQGLDDAERAELDAYAETSDSFDVAAAMVGVATTAPEALPPGLADKLLASALRELAPSTTAPAVPAVAAPLTGGALPAIPPQTAPRPPRARRSPWLYASWGVAAAAAVAAVWIWQATPAPPALSPSPAAIREELATVDDTVTYAVAGDAGVTGDIVWSNRRQRGVATLRGLAAQDPTRARYQLWIFDRARDARYPVDGGLFDRAGDVTTIAIVPRVRVEAATRFLVTSEAPAGAVVSDRGHVILQTR